MKIGAENRKQIRLLAIFGGFALAFALYTFWPSSGPATSTAPVKPVIVDRTPRNTTTNIPGGRAASQVSNASLDPTLHPEGMLLAESLEYSGSGRNIFSMLSAPPPAALLPRPIAPVRPNAVSQAPVNTVPQGPPPIDLKFFGVATRGDGSRQAFFLQGDDVFIASPGDVVARRYRVGAVNATSTEVTDLQTNNTQRLPLQMQ